MNWTCAKRLWRGLEDYPGSLRKSEGVSTNWGSWWEDVEACNEGDLKS